MKDSKLIQLLKTFDKEDWRWFRKFLHSPYFNSREELLDLFDYLRNQSPEFKLNNLKKERVYRKLYPKKTYNEKQLTYLMSYLLAQAEQFLAQRSIESNPPLVQNHLLIELINRHLDKHYNYQYNKSFDLLEKYQLENIDYYFYKYQFAEIGDLHFRNQNLRQNDNQLQNTFNNLNQFYFLKVLKHGCEMLTRKEVYGASYQLPFIENVVDFLEKKETIEPVTSIYLQIYFTLKKDKAESNFIKLKELLNQFQHIIPSSEKRIIYLYAINYSIYQISKSKNPKYFGEQCLELYLTGIKEAFLLNKGYLTPWTFKNVIKLGLNLKRYAFTEEFIQQYHKKLEQEFQEDALHFNLADLFYRKKNYSQAQYHLLQVQYSDIFYSLGAKEMLLRIYYEINEEEALLSLIASFFIYLKRNKKIAKDTQKSYLNFTSILGQISRAKKEKLPKIIEKIKDTQYLYNRVWLLEICEKRVGNT